MAQWHAQVGGQKYGPISEDEMKAWFAQGRVKATDYVWSEGMTNWVPAGSVFGASPALSDPSAPQTPATNPAVQQVYVSHSIGGPLPAAPGAVVSLVCGIIGVAVGCTGLVMGIIALTNAKKARAAIAANPGVYGGEGMATAGHVLGIIGIIWGCLALIWIIGYFTCLGAIFSTAAHNGRF